mgnify:CR=1 FL=1
MSLSKRTLAPSRPSTSVMYTGPIPSGVWEVLDRVWRHPLAIASDYTRLNQAEVSFAASMGWISNIAPDGHGYTRHWRLTVEGLVNLSHKASTR